jgi:hypothetical protein
MRRRTENADCRHVSRRGFAMLFVKKTFAAETIAAARRLYDEEASSLDDVAALLGIARTTLKARIKEWDWPARRAAGAQSFGEARAAGKRGGKPHASPRRPQAASTPQPKRPRPRTHPQVDVQAQGREPNVATEKTQATPEALAQRIQRVVERQLAAIDRVLGAIGASDSAEAERSARTLASLARALKEVMRLTAPEEARDADDDDPMPRDLDDFRRELARRLEALAAGGEDAPSGEG